MAVVACVADFVVVPPGVVLCRSIRHGQREQDTSRVEKESEGAREIGKRKGVPKKEIEKKGDRQEREQRQVG